MLDADHHWRGRALALSSITHGGDTRGPVTLLRREQMIVDGVPTLIPVISGNAVRGKLRRVAEQMLSEVLHYERHLTIPAANALRAGGSLVKASTPISGSRLARLRELVPLIGVFGTAGGGRIIDGCLQVGKLIPCTRETERITGVATALAVHDVIGLESYSRVDDSHHPDDNTTPMTYNLEVFLAGTEFDAWFHLTRPTDLEAAFFHDVITTFNEAATVAGRSAIGHGRIEFDLHCNQPYPTLDWRHAVAANRDEAIEAVNQL